MKNLKLVFSFLRDLSAWTAEMAVTGVTEIDAAIPQYWAPGVMEDGSRESFWSQLAGKEGSMMAVIDKVGPLAQNGDTLVFNTIAQLLGTGVSGESVLKGNEEKMAVGSFTVTVDMVRHAVAVTKKATKQGNFDQVKMAGALLKDWAARKMDYDIFNAVLGGGSAITTLYANSKTALASLNSTDGDFLAPTDLTNLRLALTRQGATPLKVTKVNGRSIPIYGAVMSEVDEARLYSNTTFSQEVKDGWERFKSMQGEHPLFRSAVGIYRNMLIYPYYSTLQVPQGSPLRPETIVGATLTTAGSTLTVGDGGSTVENYTLYFASSGSLQIGDEIISYTTKTTNTFGSLSRGVSGTTAIQHVPNALVTQRNISTIIGFGAEMVCRALPENWSPIGEKDDYGAHIGIGIEGYYGVALRIDKRRAKAPSACLLKAFSSNPGTI